MQEETEQPAEAGHARVTGALVGSAFLDRLGQHRHAILVLFLFLQGFLLLGIWSGLPNILTGLVYLALDPRTDGEVATDSLYLLFLISGGPDLEELGPSLVGSWLVLQCAFVWGMGSVRLKARPTPLGRRLVGVAIFATVASITLVGLWVCAWEFGDRSGSDGSQREGYVGWGTGTLAWLCLASWLVWFVVGLVLIRDLARPSATGRLLGVLIGGSWIEFLVSLPIDLAARQREQQCSCSTWSYIALAFSVPALVWALGPAVWLLYQRERRLNKLDPGRARRVLRRKSRWSVQA